MKKIILTIFFAFWITAGISSAEIPVFKPCTESTLRYFPHRNMESIAGQFLNATSISPDINCSFTAGVTAGKTPLIAATVMFIGLDNGSPLSQTYKDMVDKMYNKSRAESFSVIHDGTGSCDRYFSKLNKNSDGETIGYGVAGQKGLSMFSIASSEMPDVSVEELEGAVQYACSQVAGSQQISPSPSPVSTTGPASGANTSSTGKLYTYLAILGLSVAVIAFIFRILMHRKNGDIIPPAAIIPPQTPPAEMPTPPNDPVNGPPAT